MKKSQLRQLIKEEILKENAPGFATRNSGEPLPTLESVKAAYEAKNNIKESDFSIEEDENIDEFIRLLEQAVYSARQLQVNGETRDLDFGSLVDALRDELRGFEQ